MLFILKSSKVVVSHVYSANVDGLIERHEVYLHAACYLGHGIPT